MSKRSAAGLGSIDAGLARARPGGERRWRHSPEVPCPLSCPLGTYSPANSEWGTRRSWLETGASRRGGREACRPCPLRSSLFAALLHCPEGMRRARDGNTMLSNWDFNLKFKGPHSTRSAAQQNSAPSPRSLFLRELRSLLHPPPRAPSRRRQHALGLIAGQC